MRNHLLMLAMLLAVVCGRPNAAAPGAASAPAQPSASAAGNSFNPIFSADGRHLVFVSHANNLVTNDDRGLSLDIFVRDLVNSNTVLVSVSTNGVGSANWDANYPSVSSNGQFIAFASRASNLASADTNGAIDVFLRDVNAGVTRLVSVDVNGRAPVDPSPASIIPLSGNPMTSGDGRWVFFESCATNLLAGGAPPGSVNIYARDTWSNATVLVSAGTNGAPVAGKCELTSITPDGRLAAFLTTNNSLASGVTNIGGDAYVRELEAGTTAWASQDAAQMLGSGSYLASGGKFSDDGQYFVCAVRRFVSDTTGRVLRFNIGTAATSLAPVLFTRDPPQMSSDGRFVLNDKTLSAYVYDFLNGTNIESGWKATWINCPGELFAHRTRWIILSTLN